MVLLATVNKILKIRLSQILLVHEVHRCCKNAKTRNMKLDSEAVIKPASFLQATHCKVMRGELTAV